MRYRDGVLITVHIKQSADFLFPGCEVAVNFQPNVFDERGCAQQVMGPATCTMFLNENAAGFRKIDRKHVRNTSN